jgi:hypothetical protein
MKFATNDKTYQSKYRLIIKKPTKSRSNQIPWATDLKTEIGKCTEYM